MVVIQGKTLDEVWFQLLVELCKHGRVYQITDGSFKGSFRLELDFVMGEIESPIQYLDSGERLSLSVTVPPGCPSPTTDEKIIHYFENYLLNVNGESPKEDYRYSTFIVGGEYNIPLFNDGNGIQQGKMIIVPNQLEWCISHYKEKGFGNNHCCMVIGYPESNLGYDIPYSNETERKTSPCLRLIDTKIIKKDGKNYLNLFSYFRSWDAFEGWPENMGGLALLQEYMATSLDCEIGSLYFASKGLHIYDYALEFLTTRTGVSSETENVALLKQIIKKRRLIGGKFDVNENN